MTTEPEPKLALSRHRILTESVRYADEHGVAGLSMRKLAEQLGVGAMSLYTYVKNKDDMLEGMVDLVTAEIELPVGDDWRRALVTSSASAHQVLLDHPWCAEEWTRRMPGPARLAFMEAILRTLTEAGFDDELVYHGYHAVTMHIVGFTIQALGYQDLPVGESLGDLAETFLASIGAADLPHLATHIRAHTSGEGHGDEFGYVLGLILDGLEQANAH